MNKERIDQRSTVAKQLRDMLTAAQSENRNLTAEEKSKYDAMLADIQAFDDMDRREKELEEIEARKQMENPEIALGTKAPSVRADEEVMKELRTFLTSGKFPEEKRAMTSGTGASGGFLIPEIFSNKLYENSEKDNIIKQLATKETWRGDGAFPVVTGFGTSHWVTEGSAVTEADIVIAQKLISGFQLMWEVRIPRKLINNSAYSLESRIPMWWGISNRNAEETKYAQGAGTTEPFGLIDASTTGTTTAASTIVGDDVLNWFYALPPQYRGRADWVFGDSTVAVIRKLKNPVTTSGALNYLWIPGLGGTPDTLCGRPIHSSAGMPAFAANTEVGVFGDIKQFTIVEFGGPSMVYDEYTYASYGQVRFVGHRLIDTALPVAEAIVTCPVHA